MTPSRCAVVFDWNGTLLADSALCIRANNRTLDVLGMPHVTPAQLRAAYAVPLVHMYKAFGCDEGAVLAKHAEMFAAFSSVYEKDAVRLRARRGARETLKLLNKRGHKQTILSNYTVARIAPQAERLGLACYLDAILANEAGEAVYNKGGKGERLRRFVETHDIRRAIVVGDTPEEVEIARAYGYLGIAITGGVCSTARLRAAKPDFLIHNLGEIPAIAEKVFGSKAR